MLLYKSSLHHMLLYKFVLYKKSYYTEYTVTHIIIIWMTVCSDQQPSGPQGSISPDLSLVGQVQCLLLIGPSDNQHEHTTSANKFVFQG